MESERTGGRVPVAALLFDPQNRPDSNDLAALAEANGGFALTCHGGGGVDERRWAELLCDGLTFDVTGLAPGLAETLTDPAQIIALPRGFDAAAHQALLFSLAPNLSGVAHLLPVVRVLSGVLRELAIHTDARAVGWLPARLIMSPAWFAEAVGAWLRGGPFPVLALTALRRSDAGFASKGLAYFVGQEFMFSGKDGNLREGDVRGAVRLTDWLVAHGRVDSPREVLLSGFGAVWLEPNGRQSLLARVL